MPKIWIVKPNVPENWSFDNIEIKAGKRSLDDWLENTAKKFSWIIPVNIPENDDGCYFLNELSKGLEATTESFANTISVYTHSKYKIECSYRSDLNFQNSEDFNYFSTVVNIESANIFGPTVFYKLANNKLVDLSLHDLLSQLVNFYFLRTYKLGTNGKFEEIGMMNYEPEISKILNSYKVRRFNDWLVFSDSSSSNLDKLKESKNDIKEFSNLIWLKIKTHIGDIHDALESLNMEKNKDGDMRGIYMDLDPEYIMSVFF